MKKILSDGWAGSGLRSMMYLLALPLAGMAATPPAWWTDPSYAVWNGTSTDHHAPLNVGQLKYVATQAKAYLDAELGLTSDVWDLAYADHEGSPFPFATGSNPDNYAPANVGQLKYVATGFYEILNHLDGFSVEGMLDTQGTEPGERSSQLPVFPWADGVLTSENLAPANIGQLKLVFSFSVPTGAFVDFDGDGIDDVDEFVLINSDPNDAFDALEDISGYDDFDGDGVSNFQEYVDGTDPNDDQDLVAIDPVAVGSLSGSFSVNKDGAAVYQIPIGMPEGRLGMQPAITLNYSSQGANGFVGMGWSIGGLSSVSRGPATVTVDGYSAGVQFSTDDKFYWNGGRLIEIATNEYRPRFDPSVKILRVTGTGVDKFVVYHSDGRIEEYGASSDSSVVVNYGGSNHTLTWLLTRRFDRDGNYYQCSYTSDEGSYWIDTIDYTGQVSGYDPAGTSNFPTPGSAPFASVKFYAAARTDVQEGYQYGLSKNLDQRLDRIETLYGTTLYRKYQLSYDYAPTNGRSRLISIVESVADGSAKPATEFIWSDLETGFEDWSAFPNNTDIDESTGFALNPRATSFESPIKTWFVDFDGDGLNDMLRGGAVDSEALHNSMRTASSSPLLEMSTFNSGEDILIDYFVSRPNLELFVDVNADGLVDCISGLDGELVGHTTGVLLNTGTDFVHPTEDADPNNNTWFDLPSTLGQWYQLHDINADGLLDIVDTTPSSEGGGDGYVYLGKADSNGVPIGWESTTDSVSRLPSDIRNVPVDIDYGDGIPPGIGQAGITFTDLNGDGLLDIVVAYRDYAPDPDVVFSRAYLNRKPTGGESSRWLLAINYNLGTHSIYLCDYYKEVEWDNGGETPDFKISGFDLGVRFADLNGDGLTDLLMAHRDTDLGYGYYYQSKALINTGTGWQAAASGEFEDLTKDSQSVPFAFTEFGGLATVGGNRDCKAHAQIFDYDGDRRADLMVPHGSTSSYNSISAMHFYRNNGSGWDYHETIALSGGSVSANQFRFAEINGDGYLDFMYYDGQAAGAAYFTDGDFRAAVNTRKACDMIVKIRDGLNTCLKGEDSESQTDLAPTIEIDYAPLTGVNPAGRTNPLATFDPATGTGSALGDNVSRSPVPAHVVSTVKRHNGLTRGGQAEVEYAYGPRRSHRENGDLGYAWTEMLDQQTNLRSRTEYIQQFPYTGRVSRTTTWRNNGTSDGDRISMTENQWNEIVLDTEYPGTSIVDHFVYLDRSDVFSYELDEGNPAANQVITHSATDYTSFDLYGNALTFEELVYSSEDDSEALYSKATTMAYYTADESKWLIARPSTATVTVTGAEGTGLPVTTKKGYTYFTDHVRVRTETIEPDQSTTSDQRLVTTYGYNGFGNRTSVQRQGMDLDAAYPGQLGTRQSSTAWTSDGRFVASKTNALGHTSSSTYDPVWGVPVTSTDINGLTSRYYYDGWGRIRYSRSPFGSHGENRYEWDTGDDPVTVVKNTVKVLGKPEAIVWIDLLGREPLKQTYSGGGDPIYSATQYDTAGRAWRGYQPSGTAPVSLTTGAYDSLNFLYTETTYDAVGRPTDIELPGSRVTTMDYFGVDETFMGIGLKVVQTNPESQVKTAYKNSAGEDQKVVDNLGSSVEFDYSHQGLLRRTLSLGAETLIEYDRLGRRTRLTEPNVGRIDYTYNSLGEPLSQTQKGRNADETVTTSFRYDRLGRMVWRSESEGVTTWTYDTASGKGLGQLSEVSSPGGYLQAFTYDALGRVKTNEESFDGRNYRTSQSYDAYSRLQLVTFPTGYQVKYEYLNEQIVRVIEWLSGDILWEALEHDEQNRITDFALAGGTLETTRTYDPETGWATAIRSGTSGSPLGIQNWEFDYDAIGNLQYRDNKKLGRKEYFTYDGLNRLEYSHFGAAPTPTAYTMKMSYDANGNIASKIMHSSISPVPLAHLSTYSYQDTGILGKNYPVAPHAVSSAGGETYVYDAFGQVISGAGRSVQWTSYNKPDYIADSASRSFFDYGAGRARYQQLQESWNTGLAAWEFKRKINYHGTHFEQEILNSAGTQTKELHYILTPTGRSVTVETADEDLATRQYRYLHQDHLGSVDAVTDGLGNLVSDDENSGDDLDLNYDPWGLRRDDQMEDTTGYRKSSQRRGFTDHEHLDDLGLIHMNGRVYDPLLGRFLSPDVVVQSPSNTQSYNRYTYVRNNPLSFVDPSGYASGLVGGGSGGLRIDWSQAGNMGAISSSASNLMGNVNPDTLATGEVPEVLPQPDSGGTGNTPPVVDDTEGGNENNGDEVTEEETPGDTNSTSDEGGAGDSSGVINENAATTSTDGVPAAPAQGASTPAVTTKPLKVVEKTISANAKAAETDYSFEVTAGDGEITIQPIATILIPDKLDDATYEALVEGEMEHVCDFEAYLNGYYSDELNQAMNTDGYREADIGSQASRLENNLNDRVFDLKSVSHAFWDTPRGGQDAFHRLDRHIGITGSMKLSKPPQPSQNRVENYRLKAFGSVY